MTRDEQMRAALALLDVPKDELAEWKSRLGRVFATMDETIGLHDMEASARSKDFAKARASYAKALRRLQAAGKALDGLGWEAPITPAQIERALRWHAPTTIPANANWAEIYSGEPGVPTHKHELAVQVAHDLLTRRGINKIVSTRGDKWWQLSAILAGEDVDLFRYLLKYKRDQNNTFCI